MRFLFTFFFLCISTAPTFAQESGRIETVVPMRLSSGILQNNSKTRATIYKKAITANDAASVRLNFGRVTLGNPPLGGQPTILRITSYRDGAVQHFTSKTLKEWRYSSAWFNGSMVLVEIISDPFASPSHIELNHILTETLLGGDRSICGPIDDRILSDDPKTGRIFPIGCTAWIIDDPNHCLLSAGHCTGGIDVMEFNVPLSDENGNWQHPGPEDQYMVDPESLQFIDNTIGDDWAYFGCFPNTETGLTVGNAQEEWFTLANEAPPVLGQTIRITGYGTTSAPVDPTWNSSQKTHSGSYANLFGSSIAYTVDTTGGNSGSAVLNESTGEAIGIHTNAGCHGGGGENWGCAIHNSGLQNALANPQGVCIPLSPVIISFPNELFDSVLPNTVTPLIFTVTEGNELPIPDTVMLRTIFEGVPETIPVSYLGNNTYEAMLPAQTCTTDYGFYITAYGDEGSQTTYPANAPSVIHELVVGYLEESTLIDENFSVGLPTNWNASGLWHAGSSCEPIGTCDGGGFMYFGQDDTCTYNDDSVVTGTLTSPSVNINNITSDLTLSFCYSLITENYEGYDTAKVYANGYLLETLAESSEWSEKTILIEGITAHDLTITWIFDSVDNQFNDYRGLHVDGVFLSASNFSCNPQSCIGDMNQDNVVDVIDLLNLIDSWGLDGKGDFDNNGIVDITDMLMLISAWGPCE